MSLEPGDPGSRPNPLQSSHALNGVMVPLERWDEIKKALTSADSILSLLHYRGATVSNRHMKEAVHGQLTGMDGQDVESALKLVVALRQTIEQDVVRSAFFTPS